VSRKGQRVFPERSAFDFQTLYSALSSRAEEIKRLTQKGVYGCSNRIIERIPMAVVGGGVEVQSSRFWLVNRKRESGRGRSINLNPVVEKPRITRMTSAFARNAGFLRAHPPGERSLQRNIFCHL